MLGKETLALTCLIVVIISAFSAVPQGARACAGYEWDESVVPFMNSNVITYENLTEEFGVEECYAQAIVEYRAGADGILGSEDDVQFADIHDIEDVIDWELSTLERLEMFAKMWIRGQLDDYVKNHFDGPRDLAGGLILEGRIVTMNAVDEVIDGKIFIQGGKIVSIVAAGQDFPANVDVSQAVTIQTGGTIYPGLIDAHTHISYNNGQLWKVPKLYTSREQWPEATTYKQDITRPKNILCGADMLDMEAEVDKWGEIKAIVGGTTSIQSGSGSSSPSVTSILIHNMEYTCFGFDKVYTRVPAIGDMKASDASDLINKMNSGECEAWYVHLGEGTDQNQFNEFQELKNLGLLREETIIIHGTAFGSAQFQEMAAVGCDLVWSPTSNMLLYGNCTNAAAAAQAGVNVALGCDWSPSGCKNLLDELKVAYQLNKVKFNNYFTDKDLVKQVTINPAKQVHWENYVGSIQPGLYADILVVQGNDNDPYTKLIEATVRDVKLVLVEGEPLYGDVPIMQTLKPGDYEILSSPSGFEKAIDVTNPSVPLGSQTVAYLQSTLSAALTWDDSWLHQHVKSPSLKAMSLTDFAAYMDTTFPGIHPMTLDPIYVCDDDYFFEAMNTSTNANFTFNLEQLYYCWRANSTFQCKDSVGGITNGGYVSGKVKIAVPASDTKAVYVSVDNGTETRVISTPYMWNTTALSIGPHFISFRIVDMLSGAISYTNYSVTVRDSTPPIISVTGITHGRPVAGKLPITTSVEDQSTVTLYFGVDDGPETILNANGTFDWNSGVYVSGWHIVRFRAVDAYGFVSYRNFTVDVQDVTPPRFQLISPIDQGLVNGDAEIIFNATDENSVVYVFFFVDSEPERELLSATTPMDTKQYSNGIHTLHFRAVDAKGNTQWTNISVYVDNPKTSASPSWNELYSAIFFVLLCAFTIAYFLTVLPKPEPKRVHTHVEHGHAQQRSHEGKQHIEHHEQHDHKAHHERHERHMHEHGHDGKHR